nr:hypothetical protein [Kibdelosporangium sp. MJ126-NF4]CTQ90319.1 hypothetical protein [Kibdelosporangium sp. MJ126-NF4]
MDSWGEPGRSTEGDHSLRSVPPHGGSQQCRWSRRSSTEPVGNDV